VRWLLLKDLRILRRSPLLVALLVLYPATVSVLIGLSLSRGPEKPRVAFVNEVPDDQATFTVGGDRLDASAYAGRLFEAIDPVRVRTREEAVRMVRDGDVLGALIVPRDVVDRLQDTVSLSGTDPPELEVVYNAEDPIKARYVESTIESRLADANKALADRLTEQAAGYLDVLLDGGSFEVLGRAFDVLGLRTTDQILGAVARTLPEGSANRAALERVQRFARLAVSNLDVAGPLLQTVGSPIAVKQTVLRGDRVPLDAFAVAVAVTLSLLFVCVLLAGGMLALEREEHAVGRLLRGLVGPTALVAEKVVLSALCGAAVTLLLALGVSAFVDLDLGRAPLWPVAFGAGALAFGALGVALGALAREVRVASLLTLLVALPMAFLALVPSGAVAPGVFDALQVVNALLPFDPALQAVDAALNDADPGLGRPLAHLAAVTLAYGALGRLALRRLA
jgi:ABC-type multidrug transport system permease subunit